MDVPLKQDGKVLIDKYGKRIVSENFMLPNGKVIESISIDSTKVPAIIFPLTKDGKVVTIRQFRYAINDFVVELPGGCSTAQKSFEETAKIELLEETGYESGEIVQLSPLILMDPAFSKTSFAPMLALDCVKKSDPHHDDIEFIEVIEVPIAQWAEKVGKGDVHDLKTIALTQLAMSYLTKHNHHEYQ